MSTTSRTRLLIYQSPGQFSRLATGGEYNVSAAGGPLPEKIIAGWCSWNFFSTLRVTPALGRTFAESDDRPEAEASVMLTALVQIANRARVE